MSVRETNHHASELLVMYHSVFTFLGIPHPTSYARTARSVGILNTSRDTRHSHTLTYKSKKREFVSTYSLPLLLWTTDTCYKGKLKKSLVLTPRGVCYSIEWLTSRPDPLTFGGVTVTHRIRGWVEPRVGLDVLDKKKTLIPACNRTPDR